MTPDEFRKAFDDTWRERVEDHEIQIEIGKAYQRNATWTRFMLGTRGVPCVFTDCFLYAVGKRLGRSFCREYCSLDGVFYDKEPNLVDPGIYPAAFRAIIEHENGDRVEEEMWKLLMWRGPLKVLNFYDYHDDEKQRNETKVAWLDDKFQRLGRMAETMHRQWPEGTDSQYLFVVGGPPARGPVPRWRYFRLCQTCWKVEGPV